MPAYEFVCKNCRKRFELRLSYSEYGNLLITCPHCSSPEIQRRVGRVRFARGDKGRLESMADPAALNQIDGDPRALGRMMREMSHEVGEEMPPEFNEVVGRLEAGQSPDQIEASMPDLGADLPDMGGDLGGDDF